jgi:hypothetical protein
VAEQKTGTVDNRSDDRGRRGLDVLTLLVGLASLAVAMFAFVGTVPDLPAFDVRWLLAGVAVLVGLVLLVGSVRRSSGRDRR